MIDLPDILTIKNAPQTTDRIRDTPSRQLAIPHLTAATNNHRTRGLFLQLSCELPAFASLPSRITHVLPCEAPPCRWEEPVSRPGLDLNYWSPVLALALEQVRSLTITSCATAKAPGWLKPHHHIHPSINAR